MPWPGSARNIGWSSPLYHEQGLPYDEIAGAVGRPVGTVKTWLHRARGELAETLSRRGVHC